MEFNLRQSEIGLNKRSGATLFKSASGVTQISLSRRVQSGRATVAINHKKQRLQTALPIKQTGIISLNATGAFQRIRPGTSEDYLGGSARQLGEPINSKLQGSELALNQFAHKKGRLNSLLSGNVWPLKPSEPIFSINQDIPQINRMQTDTASDDQQHDTKKEGKHSHRTNNQTLSLQTEGPQTELKSYMDADFNPLKKHKFRQDAYLKQFKELTSSESKDKRDGSPGCTVQDITSETGDGAFSPMQQAAKDQEADINIKIGSVESPTSSISPNSTTRLVFNKSHKASPQTHRPMTLQQQLFANTQKNRLVGKVPTNFGDGHGDQYTDDGSKSGARLTLRAENRKNTSLSEVLCMDLQAAAEAGETPMSDGEKQITENDLKYFRSTNKGKVAVKQMDLVTIEQRRRQQKFLLDNPTFKIKNVRKLAKNNEALSNLAKNSLYFKSNTIKSGRSTLRSMNTTRSPTKSSKGTNDLFSGDGTTVLIPGIKKYSSHQDDFRTRSDFIVKDATKADGNRRQYGGVMDEIESHSHSSFCSSNSDQPYGIKAKRASTDDKNIEEISLEKQAMHKTAKLRPDKKPLGIGKGKKRRYFSSHKRAATVTENDGQINLGLMSPRFPPSSSQGLMVQIGDDNKRLSMRKDKFIKDLFGFRLHNPTAFSHKAFGADRLPWQNKDEQKAAVKKPSKIMFLKNGTTYRSEKRLNTAGGKVSGQRKMSAIMPRDGDAKTSAIMTPQGKKTNSSQVLQSVQRQQADSESAFALTERPIQDQFKISKQLNALRVKKIHGLGFNNNDAQYERKYCGQKPEVSRTSSTERLKVPASAQHVLDMSAKSNGHLSGNRSLMSPKSCSPRSHADREDKSSNQESRGNAMSYLQRTMKAMKSQKRKELKKKIFMPNKQEQLKIERELCKNSRFKTMAEINIEQSRKLLMKETFAKGCYDIEADQQAKKVAAEREKREMTRYQEEMRRMEHIRSKGMDPKTFGCSADIIRFSESTGFVSQKKQAASAQKSAEPWYHPKKHWSFEDEDEKTKAKIPCKEVLPGPQRPLNQVNKDKYRLHEFMENGQLIEEKRDQAYERYYQIKFENKCRKQAQSQYDNFRARVKTTFEKKRKQLLTKKSQFTNFEDQMACLPYKSRLKIIQKMDQKQKRDGSVVSTKMKETNDTFVSKKHSDAGRSQNTGAGRSQNTGSDEISITKVASQETIHTNRSGRSKRAAFIKRQATSASFDESMVSDPTHLLKVANLRRMSRIIEIPQGLSVASLEEDRFKTESATILMQKSQTFAVENDEKIGEESDDTSAFDSSSRSVFTSK